MEIKEKRHLDDLVTEIAKVKLIGDILVYLEGEPQFAQFIDSNFGALGNFLWDIGNELQAIYNSLDLKRPKIKAA